MTTALADRPTPAGPPAGKQPSQQSLAGTGSLIRFLLRRDRIKLPAWLLGITALMFYYAAALPEVIGEEQMAGMGQFMEGPVGALISGPGYGRDAPNIERLIVGIYGLYFFILAALMSILLVSRHTRVDEQNGRTELIRANVVGRHAQLTATLIVAVAANVLLALMLGGAMAANGYDGGDGLLFGAGVGAVGLVFAGIAALTMQITEYSRAASGLAGAALGGAWVIRSAGDMLGDHGSPLSWFSPLAWSQQTRPFVDGRWWPLLFSVGLFAATAAVGYVLSARRDVGAGLVAARVGHADGPPWLRSPLAYAYRLHRASLIGWAAALGAAGLIFGGITDAMVEGYADMGDDMLQMLGGDPDRLVEGYLGIMGLFMALMLGVFVILGVQSARFEETKGRAEPVLATATSRWAWLGSHIVVLAVGAFGLLLVAGLTTGIGAAFSTGDSGYVWEITAAHLIYAPAVWVLMGIAVLFFGLAPRGIGIAWVVLGYGVFAGFFGDLMDLPQAAKNVSPLAHVPQAPLETITGAPLVVLTVLAGFLIAAGLAGFRRRDLEAK